MKAPKVREGIQEGMVEGSGLGKEGDQFLRALRLRGVALPWNEEVKEPPGFPGKGFTRPRPYLGKGRPLRMQFFAPPSVG